MRTRARSKSAAPENAPLDYPMSAGDAVAAESENETNMPDDIGQPVNENVVDVQKEPKKSRRGRKRKVISKNIETESNIVKNNTKVDSATAINVDMGNEPSAQEIMSLPVVPESSKPAIKAKRGRPKGKKVVLSRKSSVASKKSVKFQTEEPINDMWLRSSSSKPVESLDVSNTPPEIAPSDSESTLIVPVKRRKKTSRPTPGAVKNLHRSSKKNNNSSFGDKTSTVKQTVQEKPVKKTEAPPRRSVLAQRRNMQAVGNLKKNAFLNFLAQFKKIHTDWPLVKVTVEGAKKWVSLARKEQSLFSYPGVSGGKVSVMNMFTKRFKKPPITVVKKTTKKKLSTKRKKTSKGSKKK